MKDCLITAIDMLNSCNEQFFIVHHLRKRLLITNSIISQTYSDLYSDRPAAAASEVVVSSPKILLLGDSSIGLAAGNRPWTLVLLRACTG
jgi:hypothetical protein